MNTDFDVIIIGSGAAGLMTALELDPHYRIALLSKSSPDDGSTNWAQGGISAVLDPADSFAEHVHDTINAGAGLCDTKVVETVVRQAPSVIDALVQWGVKFTTQDDGSWHLTREGGHSKRRVIHAHDATGQALESTLLHQAKLRDNIQVCADVMAIDLISGSKIGQNPQQVYGVYALQIATEQVVTFRARFVVLATGGASKAYLYTSNPDGSTGDGIALAWRAGCRVANMELNQFHPTCLYHPNAKSFLISEAVRGEGGKLLLPDGKPFMHRYDQREELAPRDIVARAIDNEMKTRGYDYVLLDIRHKGAGFIQQHFPAISSKVAEFGFDMARDALPVVPAAHYTCGGVMVDQEGKTDLDNVYAAGEATMTGLHGANRMASNSLLECLVYGRAVAHAINARQQEDTPSVTLPDWDESRVVDSDEMVVVSHNWDELRRFMWDYVGIVRTNKRLSRAQHRIELLRQEIDEYYSNFRIHPNLLELRNLAEIAELIIHCAIARKESRGLHYNTDYPDSLEKAENTVLTRKNT
jgi:L-aspartate oxidase